MQSILCSFDIGFSLLYLAVTYLCHFTVIAFTLCHFGIMLHLFDIGFLVLNGSDITFFFLPAFLEFGRLLFELLELGFDTFELVIIVLTFNSLTLDLQLLDLTVEVIQLFRFGIYFQTQFGSRFIDQVNRLIGQVTVGDIPC